MILLCNGDSWTQGDAPSQTINWKATKTLDWYDIIPHFGDESNKCDRRITYKFYDSPVWPKILGEKLGVETWNSAHGGASNQRIFNSTYESIMYLRELGKKDIFVVLQLTSVFRYTTIKFNKDANHVSTDEARFDGTNCPYNIEWLYRLQLRELIILQNFLKSNNIAHIIYNDFDKGLEDDFEKFKEYEYLDMDYIYNRTLRPVFKEYIENKNDIVWTWNAAEFFIGKHPTDISHIQWGEHLHKYIKENYEFF